MCETFFVFCMFFFLAIQFSICVSCIPVLCSARRPRICVTGILHFWHFCTFFKSALADFQFAFRVFLWCTSSLEIWMWTKGGEGDCKTFAKKLTYFLFKFEKFYTLVKIKHLKLTKFAALPPLAVMGVGRGGILCHVSKTLGLCHD